jgi:Uma2 family endonuclease
MKNSPSTDQNNKKTREYDIKSATEVWLINPTIEVGRVFSTTDKTVA